MILQALLVSKDDSTAETLIRALAEFGVVVDRSSAGDIALMRLAEEHFDQVIVDFDDPEAAAPILEGCRRLACRSDRNPPVTVAVLPDATQIRSILGAGAHFILVKPVSHEQAQKTLRAAASLLKRERRQSLRVAVQAPVSLLLEDNSLLEGILLDLSTGGMDVLAAKPIASGATVHASFQLQDGLKVEANAEVAWSIANGQTGLRFVDIEQKMHGELSAWLAERSRDALSDECDTVSECSLTDLSLGGCYVQTESPFPQCSAVDLCLRAPGMEIHTEGLVRVMHPAHGMGIEFPARTEEQRKSVGAFIEFLTSQPGSTPQLEASPRALIADPSELNQPKLNQSGDGEQDAEDPLLELLRIGDAMDEEEFLVELTRQRSPESVA
jgi:CheY-like chemotaxis protein